MKQGKRLLAIILLAAVVFVSGCGSDSNTAPPVNLALTDVIGNWSGPWHNTTFNSTGNTTLGITGDQVAQTASAVLNMTGPVLGGTFGAPETFNGPFTSNGFTFSGTSAVFGTFQLAMDSHGVISGSGTNLPNPLIQRVDFTGNATATTMTINYTVTFAAGGGLPAQGTINLTKQ